MAIHHSVTIVVNSALYLVAGNDEIIMVNTPRPSTVLLPSSNDAGLFKNRVLYIKDYSGQAKTNPITVMSAGGKTIDGVSSVILDSGYAHIQVVYDGINWKIISQSSKLGSSKRKLKDYLKIFSFSH